jgi:hypothetical protein
MKTTKKVTLPKTIMGSSLKGNHREACYVYGPVTVHVRRLDSLDQLKYDGGYHRFKVPMFSVGVRDSGRFVQCDHDDVEKSVIAALCAEVREMSDRYEKLHDQILELSTILLTAVANESLSKDKQTK